MGRKDFDNILKVINVGLVFTGATTASVEIDFDLPRGFIAKIFKMQMRVFGWGDDFRTVSADKNVTLNAVVLKDPDDATTISFTSNSTEHDVIMGFIQDFLLTAGAAGDPGFAHNIRPEILDIPEHIDLITARNMRLNIFAGDDDAADITEAGVGLEIYYTLEEVTDIDILNILDIL